MATLMMSFFFFGFSDYKSAILPALGNVNPVFGGRSIATRNRFETSGCARGIK
jgi:hypothetical protein